MNQHQAIAAVTSTLRRLLETRRRNGPPPIVTVSHQPPGLISDAVTAEGQVNLFLYDASVSAAWRNMDLPDKVKPGESGHPPLPLNLYYLLTAYADDTARPRSHELLGQAMAILHDSPLLNADEIKYNDGTSDYTHKQIERIRITPQPLSLDEMTKLWSTFQQDYRASTAYQVAVLLMESTRPTKTPQIVRRRGREDSDGSGGTLPDTPERIGTQADRLPPFPTILSIEPAGGQPSLEVGTTLAIQGHNLAALPNENVELQLRHPFLADVDPPISIPVPPEDRSTSEIQVTLPAVLNVPPGPVSFSIAYTEGVDAAKKAKRSTGQFSTSVAARFDVEDDAQIPTGVPQVAGEVLSGQVVIAVKFAPGVRTSQQDISLLLGSEPIRFDRQRVIDLLGETFSVSGKYSFQGQGPETDVTIDVDFSNSAANPVNVLAFVIDRQPPINQLVRLRIDGIDTLLINDRTAKPPQYRDARVIVPGP